MYISQCVHCPVRNFILLQILKSIGFSFTAAEGYEKQE